jgi:aryl-alcohol dehydrogenase-like predicted oxidoreductase
MKYLSLSEAHLTPSVICLGCGQYGTGIPAEQAWALLDAFAEQGGSFLDTARVYGAWAAAGAGASERVLGAWLKARGMRSRMIIGTKGGHPELATMHLSRLTPAEIAADLSASLDDLQTDAIDLYWLHRDDPAVPVGEILGVLNDHLAAGRIRAIGASNWTAPRLAEAASYARVHKLIGFQASQIGWSLATANPVAAGFAGMLYMDEPTLAYHQRTGLPVVAYSSQAGGFFSGKYARPDTAKPGGSRETHQVPKPVPRLYADQENFARLERARELAARRGCTPNQIALGYLLSQPFPVFPIAGCRTAEQVRASCAAAEVQLTAEEIAYLWTGVQHTAK